MFLIVKKIFAKNPLARWHFCKFLHKNSVFHIGNKSKEKALGKREKWRFFVLTGWQVVLRQRTEKTYHQLTKSHILMSLLLTNMKQSEKNMKLV